MSAANNGGGNDRVREQFHLSWRHERSLGKSAVAVGRNFQGFLGSVLLVQRAAGGAFLDARAALGGDGTETKPFTISSIDNWNDVVRNFASPSDTSGKYFKITADLSGLTSGLGKFYGHLDGDGHTITFENADHGFISFAGGATIENLEVRGTLKTNYVFGSNSTARLDNCIVNLTTISTEAPLIAKEGNGITINKSILRFGDIAWVNSGKANSSTNRVYVATFGPDVKPLRTGAIAICNGKGIVYADGFRTGGIEGFMNGVTVTISLPGIKIENYTISGTTAEKPDDSTIKFTMPDKAVSLSITQRSITYVDNVAGVKTIEDFTILNDDGTTSYPAGTYVVSNNLALDHGISFGGNSTIIVADNSYLSIKSTAHKVIANGIHTDGRLTISGQQGGTGRIDIDMAGVQAGLTNQTSTNNCIDATGDVKVNDCGIDVKLQAYVMSNNLSRIDIAGIRAGGAVSFDNVGFKASYGEGAENGKFHDYAVYAGGSITISGSRVEATSTSYGMSMVTGDDKYIYVNWRRATDTFSISSYNGIFNILNNKFFHNGRKAITGIVVSVSDVYRRTLTPCVDLWDGGVNSTRIAGYEDGAYTVFLDDRTLFKDGAWNTLTLPFSLDESKTASLLGSNGTLMTLDTETAVDGHSTGLEDHVLYLNFTEAKAIAAGRPYIIKWTDGDNLTEPVFEGVTISKGAPQPVTFSGGSFVGNYDEVKVGQDDAFRYIILSGGNKLGYSAVGSTLHNFRAHFEIDDPTAVKGYSLSFGEAGTTGIIPIKAEPAAQGIYTLDGLRLESVPTRKGIYIKDGRKVMIND